MILMNRVFHSRRMYGLYAGVFIVFLGSIYCSSTDFRLHKVQEGKTGQRLCAKGLEETPMEAKKVITEVKVLYGYGNDVVGYKGEHDKFGVMYKKKGKDAWSTSDKGILWTKAVPVN